MKYKIRVVRGAFVDAKVLDDLGARVIEPLDRDEWISIDELEADIGQVKELQKQMVRHYDDTEIPWYMDGYGVDDKDQILVAFGADDGEGGKIFEFRRDDQAAIGQVVDYGMRKGIPAEQMGFLEIDF